MNNELNERLTSLKADNDSLTTQLTDVNAALAQVILTTTATTATTTAATSTNIGDSSLVRRVTSPKGHRV